MIKLSTYTKVTLVIAVIMVTGAYFLLGKHPAWAMVTYYVGLFIGRWTTRLA